MVMWHDDETCTGIYCWCEEADWFSAEDLCRCGHEHLRHDMGHGCIECRCRGFSNPAAILAVTDGDTLT